MSINYDKALDSARNAASKSKDGVLCINGETYFLTFIMKHWHYEVTDNNGLFVVNLNVKGLTKAKAELRTWLNN